MLNHRLLSLVSSARLPLVGAIVCFLLAICAEAEVLLCLACILEQIAEASSLVGEWVRPLRNALLGLACFFALKTAGGWCAGRASAATRSGVSRLLFDKLVALGAPFMLKADRMQIGSLFGEGSTALAAYVARYVPQFILAVAAPLILAVYVGRISIVSAGIMLVLVYCMPVVIMRFMKRAKDRVGEQWSVYSNLSSSFFDAIAGLSTLKVYNFDSNKQWALQSQAERFRASTMRVLYVQLNSITIMDFFAYAGVALGALIALVQLQMGMLGVEETFGVVLLAPLFFDPMRSFGALFHTGMNGNDVAHALFAVLDEEELRQGSEICQEEYPAIDCEHLGFSYDGKRQALHDVNLHIPPNSIVGITGRSGAGKSTFARVLAGMAAPYGGSVKIGDFELSSYAPDSLGKVVTYVSKQSHLFKGTVRSNMLLADPTANDAFIWSTLQRAHIADEVLAAGGLDAPVEEGGVNFSGGQRQRLCFARAMLRETPLYIFDEAASNVDAESEKLLYNIMHEIALTKTVIVISHRLHMLTWVDHMYVFDDGKLVQDGDPSVLLSQEGPYKTLWEQYKVLEEFAASIAAEEPQPEKELSPVEEVIASLPGMAAAAMQAVVDAKQLQHYVNSSKGGTPEGHPVWIPLPDSYRKMLEDKLPNLEKVGNLPANTPGTCMSIESLDNSAAFTEKALSAPSADSQDSFRAQDVAPKQRSLFTIIKELGALTASMKSDLREALTAGVASNIALIALFCFAVCSLLASIGLLPLPLFFVGIIGTLLCALVRGPLHYAERLYTHNQTFKTLALIRAEVFKAMRRLAPAKLQSRSAGDLVSLVTADVELLEGFYSRTLTPVIGALVTATFVCVPALITAPLLGLVLLACCAVCGILAPLVFEHITQQRGADLRAFSVAMQSFLLDSLEGFSDLVQFGRASEYAQEMRNHFGTCAAGEGFYAFQHAFVDALSSSLVLLAKILLILAAWHFVAMHVVGVAISLVLVIAGISLLSCLAGIGHLFTNFGQTRAAAERILNLLEEEAAVHEVSQGATPAQFVGAEARNVSFSYDETKVLENVSVSIPEGRVVRVVGESGVGKTTLLRLMMRFWDVQSGAILLGEDNICDINTEVLRRQEAFMEQETYVFHDTLRNNIRLARPDATQEELERAIRAAALQEVVDRLPQGLDTMLGLGEAQLSEGEKQRLGLARVFLHDAPFIILDEPTSNLDALNEAAILYSLAANTEGKTILVASHRPTMAAISDISLHLT